MSVECPKCHQLASAVFRCNKCGKVMCNSGATKGSVKLGCIAKEPQVVAAGSTHRGCGGQWQKIS